MKKYTSRGKLPSLKMKRRTDHKNFPRLSVIWLSFTRLRLLCHRSRSRKIRMATGTVTVSHSEGEKSSVPAPITAPARTPTLISPTGILQ